MKNEHPVSRLGLKKDRVNAASVNSAQLMAHKVAAKKASKSSAVQMRQGKSSFAFIPSDAEIKICRWPKL